MLLVLPIQMHLSMEMLHIYSIYSLLLRPVCYPVSLPIVAYYPRKHLRGSARPIAELPGGDPRDIKVP